MTTGRAGATGDDPADPAVNPAADHAITVREASTPDLSADDLAGLLGLFRACWPEVDDFTESDVAHATGGRHWLAEAGGRIVGHLAVVSRALEADGRPLLTGYVEAVATLPAWRHRGIATTLLRAAAAHIEGRYEAGALSTGAHALYERLGWERWQGPTSVRAADGPRRTPLDDDSVMILCTSRTPPLDRAAPISCEWRDGDAW